MKQTKTVRSVFVIAILVATGFTIVAWFYFKSPSPAGRIRNIVLISIDTCRPDYLSCYGYPRQTTPNIDRIAKEGFLFTRAFSPVPLTLPAFSSMLTGTIPPVHGVHDNLEYRLGDSNVTIAEILREHGFSTSAVIGSFVLNSKFGINQGFDYYDEKTDPLEKVFIPERKGENVSRSAIEWLETHQNEKFFLFLHYFDPHQPYDPPEPFASTYRDNRYAGEVAYADHCIGRVVDKLKQLGLYDSSLIVITGDHGEMLGEHGEVTHGYFIYQGAIRVPLIFKLPGADASGTSDDLVGLIDIVPTVCALLGIDVPEEVQGIDLSGFFPGSQQDGQERHMYCESLTPTQINANTLFGLVSGRWKYIQTTRPELYDLVKDPGEEENLAGQEQEMARRLREKLRQVLDESVRAGGGGDSRISLDETDRKRIESLGYVGGGGINENFIFTDDRDDPKDRMHVYYEYYQIEANICVNNLSFAKAICEKLLEKYPGLVSIYKFLAEIARREGDLERAVEYQTRLIDGNRRKEAFGLKFDFASAYNILGRLYVSMKKSEEAIKNFREAIRIDPLHHDAHYNLACQLPLKGDTENAEKHYRKAIELRPAHANSYKNLGDIMLLQGKLDEAEALYATALALNPGDIDINTNLSRVMIEKGKSYYNLAYQMVLKGDIENAEKHYRKAIELRPAHANSYKNLGNIMLLQGKLDEAEALYATALALNPKDISVYSNLTKVMVKKGDTTKAVSYHKQALQADPGNYILHHELANLYLIQKDYAGAENEYRKALSIRPDDFTVTHQLACLFFLKGDYEQAALLYRKMIEIKPDESSSYYNLACLHAKQGQVDQAVRWLKQAVDRGYSKWEKIRTDPDLETIRSAPGYLKLIEGT